MRGSPPAGTSGPHPLPTLPTPRTNVLNRNVQSCMETEVGGLRRHCLRKAWSFIYPEASVLPVLGAVSSEGLVAQLALSPQRKGQTRQSPAGHPCPTVPGGTDFLGQGSLQGI